ncbi:MAG: terminase small subunit [Tetragenococcus koreensis]|nr:terminase small subunit [Tetragenococcus koreensis]
MTNWEEIRNEFESSGITMKALAEKHDVKPSTLRSRKNREGWARGSPKKETKNVATRRNKKKNVATQKAIEELNNNDEFTEQQKQFCLLYLQYFNATKAYKEAYGCDYNSARAAAPRLLANVSINKELSRLKELQRKELYVDSLDIKKEWLKQAFADLNDFVEYGQEEQEVYNEESGKIEKRIYSYVHLKKDVDVDGTLIQEVKQGRDGVSVKLYDKQKALQELMKLMENKGDGVQVTIVDAWSDDDDQ